MEQTLIDKSALSDLKTGGSRWVVIIYNDDITPVDFVYYVLYNVFGKDENEASEIIRCAESDGSAAVKYYSDPSMAQIAVALTEDIKKKYKQQEFKLKVFEITE
ncbi:MAG: ATP-dependent Clp protease adaptor ClpS [Oscillospiraceae bacterium]|nr:ATP-dependent Clp protease adaptor ClpS [Oscillospiraceae bacterium]